MPNYNTQLQSNNINLQAILSMANKLPLAGGDHLVDNLVNENAIIDRTISVYTNSRITNLRPAAFAGCLSLSSVNLPAITTVGANAFHHCKNLLVADFSAAEMICKNAFFNCWNLSSVYIQTPTVCTLEHSNAFGNTPFAGYSYYFSGVSHIYVPASLVSTYQSATNWTYFSSYFSAIESLGEVITFTIDDVEYQAESGMTWGEWVESEYGTGSVINERDDEYGTGEIYISGNYVYNASGYKVYSTQQIISGAAYNALIEFYINNVIYKAKYGMTWQEWFASTYNVNNWDIHDYLDTTYVILDKYGTPVSMTDVIDSIDNNYSTELGSGWA